MDPMGLQVSLKWVRTERSLQPSLVITAWSCSSSVLLWKHRLKVRGNRFWWQGRGQNVSGASCCLQGLSDLWQWCQERSLCWQWHLCVLGWWHIAYSLWTWQDAVKLVMEVCGCQELWFHTSIEDSIKQPVCNGRYICYVAHISMNNAHVENVYMDVSKNNGTPKSSHFNMVFHYKPLHVGGNTPIFGETSIYCKCRIPGCHPGPLTSVWGMGCSTVLEL